MNYVTAQHGNLCDSMLDKDLSKTRFIVSFPNKKVVSVAVTRKCGSSTAYSIMGYPRTGVHDRDNKEVLFHNNEFWIYEDECPHDIDYRFAIIRDPIERLLSVYRHRILIRNKDNVKDKCPTWDSFVNNIEHIQKNYYDVALHSHFQTDKLGLDPTAYDKIFLTDNIDNTFVPCIKEISGTNIPPIKLKPTKQFNDGIVVTQQHVDLIKEYYRDDCNFLQQAQANQLLVQ